MADIVGIFDTTIDPVGWFEWDAPPDGWFDADLLSVSAGSGAINYALTGSSGSYAVTGNAASFKRGYAISGASGSYSLTGNAATLTYVAGASTVNYTLSGAAGSYAVTGFAGGFKVGHSLSGSAGSCLVTGKAATLTYTPGIASVAYSLSGASGSYAVTGHDAEFYIASEVVSFSQEIELTARKWYVKRKKQILVFNTAREADNFLASEAEAEKAIQQAQKTSRRARKRLRERIITVEPIQTVDIDLLSEAVNHFAIPVDLPNLLAQQDFERVMQIMALAMQMQDEEDVELLLLGM